MATATVKKLKIAQDGEQVAAIRPPNIQCIMLNLIGTAPLMVNRFGQKAKQKMMEEQAAGSTAKSKRTRGPKDFEASMRDALYIGVDENGNEFYGIHAGSFRAAAISACRLVGFKMTLAKLSIFIEQDGFDKFDATPLVKIISPDEPELHIGGVRNANGNMDLRARPLWRRWGAELRIRFDADQFTFVDIANLIARVGSQVGVSEGRPDSKSSIGLGFGLFRIEN